MCNACHGRINPLGFTLEEFDGIGKSRKADNGKPIDSSGTYRSADGKLVTFSDAADLARYLADSQDAQRAFVTKLFQNLLHQPAGAYGAPMLNRLTQSFVKGRYSIRGLMARIAVETATVGEPRQGLKS